MSNEIFCSLSNEDIILLRRCKFGYCYLYIKKQIEIYKRVINTPKENEAFRISSTNVNIIFDCLLFTMAWDVQCDKGIIDI